MPTVDWETPDIEGMLKKDELPEAAGQAGATTTANVGPYQVPLGPMLRRPDIVGGAEDEYLKDIPDAYKEILGLGKRK